MEPAGRNSPWLGDASRCRRLHGRAGHVAQHEPQSDDLSCRHDSSTLVTAAPVDPTVIRGIEHRRGLYGAGAAQLQIAAGHAGQHFATRSTRWKIASIFRCLRRPGAFQQAYFQPTESSARLGCNPCTYSGYTNENKVIALAAELSDGSTTLHAGQYVEQGYGPDSRVARRRRRII